MTEQKGNSMVRMTRWFVVSMVLPTLLAGAGVATIGCGQGGGDDKQMVAPPVPPEQASKDSMDYYKSQMSKKGAR